jgi:uncharacterized protein (DUF433 family)
MMDRPNELISGAIPSPCPLNHLAIPSPAGKYLAVLQQLVVAVLEPPAPGFCVLDGLPREVSRMFDRITFERNMMGDRACIRGMRIPVSVIVGQFAHGATEQQILADYPDLQPEDLRQALEYATNLTKERVRVR